MKKVVSLAWFRHNASAYESESAGDWSGGRFFPRHFPAILRAYKTWFPDWEIRIHHDGQVSQAYYGEALLCLERMGLVKLVHVGEAPSLCGAMLWRMMPAFEPGVDVVICRDLDSMPSPRERRIVQRWVDAGRTVHAIHDSTSHNGTPMMGGMIGVRPQRFREMTGIRSYAELIERAGRHRINLNNHGSDQVLLNLEAWPRVRSNALIHKLKGGGAEGAVEAVFGDGYDPMPPDIACYSPEVVQACNAFSPHIGAIFPHYQPVAYYDGLQEREGTPEATRHALASVVQAERETHTEVGVPKPVEPESRVLFSCDLNQDYAFYLPLSTIMWRKVVGMRAVIMLIGEPQDWEGNPRCRLAAQRAREHGAELHYVPRCPGHRDSTVAQVARLYAGLLLLPPQSRILTADADMWPLQAAFFRAGHNKPFSILFANAYLKDVGGKLVPEEKYPICFLGGTVANWRAMMQLPKVSGRIGEEIQAQLDAGLGRDSGSDSAWNYDELLLGTRFHEWAGRAGAFLNNRHGAPPTDRVDRSCWPADQDLHRLVDRGTDCHLPRPGYTDLNWPKLRAVFHQKTSGVLTEWADTYRAEFLAA